MFHLNDLQGEVKRSGPRIRRDIHINMLFCFKYVKYNGGGGVLLFVFLPGQTVRYFPEDYKERHKMS